MSVLVPLLVSVWLAGTVGFALHGYRCGLGTRLFHPALLANLLGWPLSLALCLAVRLRESSARGNAESPG